MAGLSGISSRRFLLANLIGRVPGVLILTLVGSHGLQLSYKGWGILAFVLVTFYVAGRYCMSMIKRRNPSW